MFEEEMLGKFSREGDVESLRWLLSTREGKHMARTARFEHGESALMLAASSGDSEENASCVELLLPHSDLHACDDFGRTALMLAAREFQFDSVELLLPSSEAEAKCKRGLTAMGHAAEQVRGLFETSAPCGMIELLAPSSDHTEALELLKEFGAESMPAFARLAAARERDSLADAMRSGLTSAQMPPQTGRKGPLAGRRL